MKRVFQNSTMREGAGPVSPGLPFVWRRQGLRKKCHDKTKKRHDMEEALQGPKPTLGPATTTALPGTEVGVPRLRRELCVRRRIATALGSPTQGPVGRQNGNIVTKFMICSPFSHLCLVVAAAIERLVERLLSDRLQ